MNKAWTFEDLPAPAIELELQYTYSYDPGRISGPPEDCYPPEEECEVCLPAGYKQIIRDEYLKAAELAIAEIERQVEMLEDSDSPREWAEEERESAMEDWVAAEYDRRHDNDW